MNQKKFTVCGIACLAVLGVVSLALAQKHTLVNAKDGSGVFGYKDTPVQPWSGYHVHDPDRPMPKRVTPGESSTAEKAGTAPSDAIVLFDGTNLDKWHSSDWKVENGYAEAARQRLVTKDEFGDCQLHLEWQAPDPPRGGVMDRGNNGVMLMGVIEVQIFDSYDSKIYPDGQAAAIYAQTPPLVNACRKPGEWQSYDIVFLAPQFENGKLVKPAHVTMLHNGLLVHHYQEIYGSTPHATLSSYDDPKVQRSKGPLEFGAHNNPVRFRNIWIRPLPAPPSKRSE